MKSKRTWLIGLFLITISFLLSKFLLFALPAAADLGKLGRGIFREAFIALNLFIGYRFIEPKQEKQQFLTLGLIFEGLFIATVSCYAWMTQPPNILMQIQVMFRELLLSPMYFFGFYMIQVNRKSAD